MLATEPILLLVTLWFTLLYGLIYAREHFHHLATPTYADAPFMLVFEAYPVIFIERHGMTINQNGLTYIGLGIGMCVGTAISLYVQRNHAMLVKEWRGFPPPELGLIDAMMAGPCLVVGVFWLGWTGNYASVPWYVSALGGIPIGIGMVMSFISLTVRKSPL